MKHYLTPFIFLLTITLSHSQTSPEDELGAWYTYFGNHRISNKISIVAGGQIWAYEPTTNLNLLLLKGGINYHINSKLKVELGYSFLDIDRSIQGLDGKHVYEYRISEQIAYKHKLSNLPIDHRLRLEQRLFNLRVGHSSKNRLRYRLGTKINLNKTLFIRANNEVIFHLEKDFFSENRLYGALGINLNKSCNLQLGHMYRYINDLNLHRLQISLFIKTDHRKKKV
ncbi:DUF2490 domain-containing protein [Flavivirga abyssicola]|uniref:DUF2490 domain-containing protein n=1 Tax=Flavivirga abyssicola TaxID=3063533 RepID=UPI0026DFFBF5|nr:DUF2490 domain-containing protein [Flavivirga sp. MEBiC07777]WVK12435.1 DUF2490 domain-containing protein [Flavivirga sp. MEBiC07777]